MSAEHHGRGLICLFIVCLISDQASFRTEAQSPPRNRRLPLTMVHQRRRVIGSASEPIKIRIGGPGSRSTGRIAPSMSHPLPESSIPVIKFHTDSNNPTNNVTDADVREFYEKMAQMNLHRMSGLLRDANLTRELLKIGPCTLFAPTDDAFSLSSPALLESVRSSPDPTVLRNFLLHHVIRGHMLPTDVRNDFTMPTIHPSAPALRFNVYNGGQIIAASGAQFLGSSMLASNVLVQPIDRVLFPMAKSDMVQVIRDSYNEMYSLLQKSGLTEQLASGTFTVFVPTNEAFSALPSKARQVLLTNSTLLRKLLLNHVVPGSYFSTVLSNGYRLKPLGGGVLIFTTRRGLIMVNGVPIVQPDQPATNGLIHTINRVLVPDELIDQCRCMTKYPLVPATLKPVSQLKNTDSEPVSNFSPDGTEPTFGTRTRTAPKDHTVNDDVPLDDPLDEADFNANSFGKMNRRPALVNLLGESIKLPDGRTITFSTATPLFRKSLLLTTLRQPASTGYTVLLPSDEAFRNLPPGKMDALQQDPSRLTKILRWHILDGTVNPSTLTNNSHLKTLSGGTLPVIRRNKVITIGGIRVLAARRASNGAVFAVDRVLYPPPEVTDIFQQAQSPDDFPTDDLSIWRKLIDDVPDLKQQLKSRDQQFTMFAPTNAAFSVLRSDQFQRLLKEESLKRDLIRSHVLSGVLYKAMLRHDQVLATLFGNELRCSLVPDGFLVNDAKVTRPGIHTSNGVVYIVDKFLSFPDSFNHSRALSDSMDTLRIRNQPQKPFSRNLEMIARENNATTFLKWIHASGLRNTITFERNCTLFLPTNEAIATMSPTVRMFTLENRKALKILVQYHICQVPVKSIDDINRNELLLPTALPKKPIRCNAYKNNTVITASGCPVQKVIAPKREVSVVLLDKPLSPPVGDLFLTMSKSPLLRNFTKIVKVANMEKELRSGAPYTVFAPTKCAFAKMTPDEYERLITDQEAARAFVSRHLVPNCFFTSGIYDGLTLTATAGNTLHITTTPECIEVNGVKLKYGDLVATNGVLHVVANFL